VVDAAWDYRGPYDLRAMQDLVRRLWRPGARWHIGDVAWRRYQHVGREPGWRTRLWSVGGDTAAWGWVVAPGDLELVVDPEHGDVVSEILSWAGQQGPPLSVGVVDTDRVTITALEAAGYRPGPPDEPYLAHLCHDLDGSTTDEPRLPPGFGVDGTGEAMLAERVATHRAAFDPSTVTVDSYRQVRACWPYRHDLDVSVVDPDGTVVAACLAWYDDGNRAGLLEPVATRPEYERRGLAGAACTEALRRLRSAGATVATVVARGDAAYPGPLRLYQSIGFRPVSRDVTYRLAPFV
jgi:ribosomal protein S18 acetylase RimI-like enzyme